MRVGVLLPVKNGARHLGAALRSLHAQTHPADEIVAVDDRSCDATHAILRAWMNRLPLRVVAGGGGGIAQALNRGLEVASQPWIVRMDADDVMHPRRIEKQLAFARDNPDLDVVGTEVLSVPPSRVTARRVAYDAWISSLHTPEEHARDIYVEAPLAHPTVMLRRSKLEEVGGYHKVEWPEDYDLWLRLHGAGARMGKPPGILHFWREHGARLSRTHVDYTLQAIRRCRLHHLVEHMNLKQRPVVMVGAGFEGKAAGRVLIEEGVHIVAHVDADPRKVGGRLMGEGGVRVFAASQLVPLARQNPDTVVVVAIGTAGARPGLRGELRALGFTEGLNAVVAA
jgi:GT2 family glycosyltransferase